MAGTNFIFALTIWISLIFETLVSYENVDPKVDIFSLVNNTSCQHLVFLVGGCSAQYCNLDSYERCTRDVSGLMDYVVGTPVPVVDYEYLEDHCDAYSETSACFAEFYWHCTYSEKATLDGLDDAYEWICSEEGSQGYRRHAGCLRNDTLHEELLLCKQTYDTQLLLISQQDISEWRFYMCIYVNEMLDCKQNAVHTHCGEEAAIWTREFETRYLTPSYQLYECTFREEGPLARNQTVTYCTRESLDECLVDTSVHLPSVISSFTPVLNSTYLDEHCRDFDESATCFENFYWHCPAADQANLDSIVHAYTWICHEGKEEYRNYSACLQQPALQMQGQSCNASARRYPARNNREACEIANEYFDCITEAVRGVCGEAAARWTREFDRRIYADDLEAIYCQMNSYGDVTSLSTPQIASTSTITPPRACTQNAINRCMADVQDHLDTVLYTVFPRIDVSYLEGHCTEIVEAGECIGGIYDQCTIGTQQQVDGIVAAYSWICDEGKERYIRHAACLGRRDLIRQGIACDNVFQQQLYRLQQHYNQYQLCEAINDYLDCAHDAVEETCGTDASDWTREFDVRLLQPLYTAVSCRLRNNPGTGGDGSSTTERSTTDGNVGGNDGQKAGEKKKKKDDGHRNTTAVVIGVVVVFLCLAIVSSAVVFFALRIYKRRAQATSAAPRGAVYVANGATPNAYITGGAVASAPPGSTQAGPLPSKDMPSIPPEQNVNMGFTKPEYTENPPPYTTQHYLDLNMATNGFESSDPLKDQQHFYARIEHPPNAAMDASPYEDISTGAYQQNTHNVQMQDANDAEGIVNPLYNLQPHEK